MISIHLVTWIYFFKTHQVTWHARVFKSQLCVITLII